MQVEYIKVSHIPAALWGEKSDRVIIAVHGNMSSKTDIPIAILAEETVPLGYQVISFDLPEHGDRKNEPTLCKVQNCISDLKKIMDYAKSQAHSISLMANSMGAYFSLMAYKEDNLKHCLFLSPVVNMQRLIENTMKSFHISEEQLCREKTILTPIGLTLYCDYYRYVKEHPVQKWNTPTSILYGKKDEICAYDSVASFAERFGCQLDISDTSEHYFHTEKDLTIYRRWIRSNLAK